MSPCACIGKNSSQDFSSCLSVKLAKTYYFSLYVADFNTKEEVTNYFTLLPQSLPGIHVMSIEQDVSDNSMRVCIYGIQSLLSVLLFIRNHTGFSIKHARPLFATTLEVDMNCNKCVAKITSALQALHVVKGISCSLPTKKVLVLSDSDTQEDIFVEALKKIGKEAKPTREVNTYLLKVEGMKCQSCEQKILKALSGLHVVLVSAKEKQVIISGTAPAVSSAQDIITSQGFKVSSIWKYFDVPVFGMNCSSCVSKIQASFKNTFNSSLHFVHVNLEKKKLLVGFGIECPIVLDDITALLQSLGYKTETPAQNMPALLDGSLPESVNEAAAPEIVIKQESDVKLEKMQVTIEGMSCASCVSKIESALHSIKGVTSCSVNLLAQKGVIMFDPILAKPDDIVKYLTELGYESTIIAETNDAGKIVLELEEWSESAESMLASIAGVKSIVSDVTKRLLTIEYDDAKTCPRKMIQFLASTLDVKSHIYRPASKDLRDSLLRKKEIALWRRLFLFSLIFGIPVIIVMILDVIPPMMPYFEYGPIEGLAYKNLGMFLLATPIQFIGGYKFYLLAFLALKKLSANMNTLVSIGAWLAYGYSIFAIIYSAVTKHLIAGQYFEISASLILFLLLGRWLENIAKSKTSQALVTLMDLQPTVARLLEFTNDKIQAQLIDPETKLQDEWLLQSTEQEIPLELVAKNDILKVIPGDKIPVDGKVIFGQSSVNESLLTGESVPQDKKIGSDVIGGTINIDGMLLVRAERVGQSSTLSSIAKLVEDAQTQKPKIQILADKLAGLFVPVIIALSIAIFVLWIILGYTNAYDAAWRPKEMPPWVFALLLGITTIIVSCPCALGLATPTAVLVGTGVGASNGVLIKGGAVMETARGANVVCFDKTGTLTKGKMSVTELLIFRAEEKKIILGALLAAEQSSEHPIARALVNYCQAELGDENMNVKQPEEFAAIAGRGVSCIYDGRKILVGNLAFMVDEKVDQTLSEPWKGNIDELLSCNTPVYVSIDGKLVAVAAVADTLKEESKAVVAKLQRMGLTVYMLTGDQPRVAHYIGKQVNISEECVLAGLTPAGKAMKVKELRQSKKTVIMVGDGINDSPSLAEADIGIAVAEASDVAMECADIVLMSAKNSLQSVVTAIDLARATYRRIIFNYIWAFGYNILAIPIAAGALMPVMKTMIPPWVASIAMVLSSLSVLISSLLLRLYRKPKISY